MSGSDHAEPTWEPLLADLARRRDEARAMGGAERLARHRGDSGGRLDARARINHLLDPGSFREVGTLVGSAPADGIVTGTGTVDGRPDPIIRLAAKPAGLDAAAAARVDDNLADPIILGALAGPA